MAKWCGKIGFATMNEATPGVWTENIVERTYYGDLLRNTRRFQASGNLNDNVVVSNELSIVADPFVKDNLRTIRYVEFMGTKWKVSSADVQYPRLILALGDVYNG